MTYTSKIDLSLVYGHEDKVAAALRTFSGGLMKTSDGPDGELLPLNCENGSTLVNMANSMFIPDTQLFAAGDERANENVMLTVMQTLFLREHNRLARSLPSDWSDEMIYQTARKWNIAQFQSIVYNQYLPTVMGEPFPKYTGYNPNLNPQTDLHHSTAFFRYGHDQIPTILYRVDEEGRILDIGNVLLRDSFFDPTLVTEVGIGPYLRGASSDIQMLMDAMVVDDVRDLLFDQDPFVSTDLVARNIQRGREFGLGSYNDAREAFGLSRCSNFSCITQDPVALASLIEAYGNEGVDQVDVFVGALIETKYKNSAFLGELLFTGFVDQFSRFRDGDRFWYQNEGMFTQDELKQIESVTIGDIINRNVLSKKRNPAPFPSNAFMNDRKTAVEIFSSVAASAASTVINFFI